VARRNLDLKLVGWGTVVAALLVTATPWSVARVVSGAFLALLAPGYGLSAALLPRRPGDRFSRAMLGLGMSLAFVVVAAVVLNGAGVPLTERSWCVVLTVVTLVACVVAARRREAPSVEESEPLAADGRSLLTRRLVPATIALVLCAVALVGGAFALARQPAANVTGYSELWALRAHGAPAAFSVGVTCDELKRTSYIVKARVGSSFVLRRRITLRPGRSWQWSGRVPNLSPVFGKTLQVVLVKTRRPDRVYRRVRLTLGGV
jgi:uncharacterized membrane protein